MDAPQSSFETPGPCDRIWLPFRLTLEDRAAQSVSKMPSCFGVHSLFCRIDAEASTEYPIDIRLRQRVGRSHPYDSQSLDRRRPVRRHLLSSSDRENQRSAHN